VLELSHNTLEHFEGHKLLAEDAVRLPDVGCRFLWWELHCALDPIEPESNHVFGAVKVALALPQLFWMRWVPCHLCAL
jgi:hypothetical protein